MTTHGTGSFEIKSYDENVYQEIEGKRNLSRAHGLQTFHGAIEGEGTADYLMAHAEDGSAVILGLLRVVGAVGGRSGTFVLQFSGTAQGHEVSFTWSVVPNAGTGDLRGLRGQGGCPKWAGMSADWTLDYEFV